jgi:peptidoglycan/xylan/chitin deacetylase (PgdA/CDA1 family)
MEIVRLLEERKWAGTFFLNVYEQRQIGEDAMRAIARRLQDAHQDIALHTHPDAAYDPARSEMYEYSLDEQTTIIADGVRMLRSWTGQPVVAHRAGAYSADARTLVALQRNGIRLDSSRFWGNSNSRLSDLGLPRNLPGWHSGVLEIPVTVYLRQDRPVMTGSMFAPVTTVRKIDAAWFFNQDEMRSAIDAAVKADVPVLVIFLHSFSFIAARGDAAPVADPAVRAMFTAIMDEVAQRRLAVVSMRDLADGGMTSVAATVQDIVPEVEVRIGWPRYAWRQVKGASRVRVAAAGGGALVLVAVGLLLTARRLRRRWPAATVSTSHGGRPS